VLIVGEPGIGKSRQVQVQPLQFSAGRLDFGWDRSVSAER
jgi:hypothetical protein